MVVLNPQEISTFGFLEGDLLPLYNHGEIFRVPVSASSNVLPGRIAVPARIRRQLDLTPGGRVTIIQSAPSNESIATNHARAFVIGEVKQERNFRVWIHPSDLGRLQAGSKQAYLGKGPFPSEGSCPIQPAPEQNTAERVVIASDALMKKLTLTVGDTFLIEASS
jgi:bifunctional DNA-binding transcriptional regulator/antitoxin component of YhaV-PrlF toxin-antitoxin module